jgi:hypothetical protein
MSIFRKPHYIFWIFMIIVFLNGLFSDNKEINFIIHDWFYVIHYSDITLLATILLGVNGFIFWLLYRKNYTLSLFKNVIHLILAIDILILAWLNFVYSSPLNVYPNNFYTNVNLLLLLLLVIGQIVGFCNWITVRKSSQ